MGKLGIYLLANYPSKESFIKAVGVCQEAGIDFLEVGFPFSDPVADGDLLEKACCETIQKYSFNDTLETFLQTKNLFNGRLYVMTYTNVVYSMGVNTFAQQVGPISGIILADLPVREARMFDEHFGKYDIHVVKFLTPESREEDIRNVIRNSRGFVYFVSKRGTTGGTFDLDGETKKKIAMVRAHGKEVFVGFGIKHKRDIDLAFNVADGAIIGTKAVSELQSGVKQFTKYIANLR